MIAAMGTGHPDGIIRHRADNGPAIVLIGENLDRADVVRGRTKIENKG